MVKLAGALSRSRVMGICIQRPSLSRFSRAETMPLATIRKPELCIWDEAGQSIYNLQTSAEVYGARLRFHVQASVLCLKFGEAVFSRPGCVGFRRPICTMNS
jgi:hypothetical protein